MRSARQESKTSILRRREYLANVRSRGEIAQEMDWIVFAMIPLLTVGLTVAWYKQWLPGPMLITLAAADLPNWLWPVALLSMGLIRIRILVRATRMDAVEREFRDLVVPHDERAAQGSSSEGTDH